MRSGTSFFNSTLYRKTMHRFWPLWTLYGLIWLFALPLNMLNRYFDNLRWGVGAADTQHWMLTQATDVPGLLTFGVIMAVGFSVLCAMAAFGYLYNNRSAAMFHALPLRREALFTTQYLAGLSFLLLPNLAVAALTAAVEMATLAPDAWGVALKPLLIWLLAQSGVCLFFFSFASFCATFTGHILALPAFYGILNFLVLALYELVIQLAQQFYFGFAVSGSNDLVAYCTPAAYLMEACRWDLFWKDGVQPSSRHLYSPARWQSMPLWVWSSPFWPSWSISAAMWSPRATWWPSISCGPSLNMGSRSAPDWPWGCSPPPSSAGPPTRCTFLCVCCSGPWWATSPPRCC